MVPHVALTRLVLATTGPSAAAHGQEFALRLLLQLIAILAVTRVVVWVCKRFFGQTEVTGEILAGLVLGPSLFGALFPNTTHWLFDPMTSPVFVGVTQVGLVLLMFQIGMEFEFRRAAAGSRLAIGAVSLSGVIAPFLLGYMSAPWFYARIVGTPPSELGFRLFFATALSITALPVLGRIFIELGLNHTRTAALTVGAAAIDDVVGWTLLGVVSAVVTANFEVGSLLLRLAGLAAYLAVVFLLLRPWLARAVTGHVEKAGYLKHTGISLVLLLLFASGAVTSLLGVFAEIGGFVIGVALHDQPRFTHEWKSRVSPLVNTFFLPVFFAFTGLRTDVGALHTKEALVAAVFVCALAFAGKFGGTFTAARALGESTRTAAVIGVCMNTRGLMELIAINVGYDLGVLSRELFTMLVLMALASTYVATPLIRRLMAEEMRPVEPPLRNELVLAPAVESALSGESATR